MERNVIRDRLTPDYAEFIIGPAEGRTRWLHPGDGLTVGALLPQSKPLRADEYQRY